MRWGHDDIARDTRDILRFGVGFGDNIVVSGLLLKQLSGKGSYLSTLFTSTQQQSQRRQGRLHYREDSQVTLAFAKTSYLKLHATSVPGKDIHISRTANTDVFNTMMMI